MAKPKMQDVVEAAAREKMVREHPIFTKLDEVDKARLRDHLSYLPQWRQADVYDLLVKAVS